jgi:hypothetical protein
LAIVPKNSTAYAIHTIAIRMSIGHSSSAYSLPWVRPIGRVIAAATMTACQPQNTKLASLSESNRTWQVRCTTCSDVANRALPPKAKITALVCRGRSRP